ncbi:GTPase binding protein Rid1 [Cordyceps fumosorosea ARSEF 2679]|uniref:GTPase binding protein Rid1 n=1 Tax=Cordyceps fumosorosea (strain ARSEF 2679) TaxID=1081104 RepID=A0A168BMH0_CORFA|nr:GTPase binding protein Rid1 [Cordyceps fumosorosea ARSEF 2679]OAA70308.1 GTPase binding protein Rid1 [Cordyceps fumosorosea ARSEF 2679]
MPIGNLGKPTALALGEIQGNQQHHGSRSPVKPQDNGDPGRSKSPTKSAFTGLKSMGDRWGVGRAAAPSREPSPTKPPKAKKSSTNLAGLLSRPRSFINLQRASGEISRQSSTSDKENRTPEPTMTDAPPIYAQFTSTSDGKTKKARPQSCHPSLQSSALQFPGKGTPRTSQEESDSSPAGTAAFRGHVRGRSVATAEPTMNSDEIAVHLEALLDRRNIPQNQRYKMRNLNDTIKMEFIRQDWAEMRAGQTGSLPRSDGGSVDASTTAVESEAEDDSSSSKRGDRGRSRGRSFTFSRSKRNRSSSKKPKAEGSIGRRWRSKSTESIGRDHPEAASSGGGTTGSSVLSKIKFQQGPGDYVAYLRKVQKPEAVEVGKLHKLRLLLRNETVAWTEEFIRRGGLEQIVGLLNRIMEVEWREEHEDALLHENLLCLKALSTTALGMEYLHTVQADLLPKLLHLIFDPEKKGPSEFTTRNIITSVLLMYMASAPPAERVIRAKNVLGHLRDPQPREEDRPPPFLLGIHQERPYRVWCKEVVSVTKEVFWIFLHHVNAIALPKDAAGAAQPDDPTTTTSFFNPGAEQPYAYMHRHFAAERPPVAAAPYVGGVEWDATNYLASHLDLVNAIVACAATRDARNALRSQLRVSGWERCMGGSLRLCKEKFYGSVHAALRTWVAAAAEDGWDVRDVRFGPEQQPSRAASPRKVPAGGKVEEPPKLDMPRFDLGL